MLNGYRKGGLTVEISAKRGETLADFGDALPRDFYLQDTRVVAKSLLNCVLVYETAEGICAGRISETEAYLFDDPASHTFRGLTARCALMFGLPGRAYIYFTYGMHHCLNAVTAAENCGEAVLIRALEPLAGRERMALRRGLTERDVPPEDAPEKTKIKFGVRLCGGPGKLCQAFGLTREQSGLDLTGGSALRIAPPQKSVGHAKPADIFATPRIGIARNADALWRYTIANDLYTSR